MVEQVKTSEQEQTEELGAEIASIRAQLDGLGNSNDGAGRAAFVLV